MKLQPQIFAPGEQVVCIDDDWTPDEVLGCSMSLPHPKKDEVYTVKNYDGLYSPEGIPYLRLEEFSGPQNFDQSFEQVAFAPLISDDQLAEQLAEIEKEELCYG